MAKLTEFFIRGAQYQRDDWETNFKPQYDKTTYNKQMEQITEEDSQVDVLDLPPTEEELLAAGIDTRQEQEFNRVRALEEFKTNPVFRDRAADIMQVSDQLAQGVAAGEFDLATAEENLTKYAKEGVI